MKAVFFLFSLFTSTVYFSQQLMVISSSKENTLLFDYNNPQSLVSLISTSKIPMSAMNSETANRLRPKGLVSNLPYQLGPQSDIPLTNSYGEDSLVEMEGGLLAYLYPPRDSSYVDLEGITKLILTESKDSTNNFGTFQIDSIYFAKKYPGSEKYEIVGSCRYADLIAEHQLLFFETISVSDQNELLSNPTQLFRTIEKEQIADSKKELIEWFGYFDPDYSYRTFESISNRENYFNNDWYRSYSWPYTSLHSQNLLEDLKKIYPNDSIYYYLGPQSDIPLTNRYGEDSIFLDGGTMIFIYPAPDTYIYWVDHKPDKVFFLYSVSNDEKILERIVFTDLIQEKQRLMAIINPYKLYRNDELYFKQLREVGILPRSSLQSNWNNTLKKACNSSKHYQKFDSKQLRKEFVDFKL